MDIRGIGRALFSWVAQGSRKYRQGGSTITQQLVKNIYLTQEKTLQRKYNEALLAMALENKLSQQTGPNLPEERDILALYCNEIYLGQHNGVGVRGVAQGARVFFGKDLSDINLDEAATIAAMIQSPARYAPDRHAEAATVRRNLVLNAMVQTGAIDQRTGVIAKASPVQAAPSQIQGNEFAPYYIDAVNRLVESLFVFRGILRLPALAAAGLAIVSS